MKRAIRLLILAAACLCLATTANSQTNIHVSVTGSDATGDGSLANPYGTIQFAINLATAGDSVLVLPGTYLGSGNRDLDFLGKAITVKSRDDDATTCIIDCQGSGGDPHRGVWFHTSEDTTSILQALTITGGGGVINGGGILVGDPDVGAFGATPLIKDCVIIGNEADNGAGLAVFTAALIRNCDIQDNTGNGLFLTQNNGAEVVHCRITGNTTYGAVAVPELFAGQASQVAGILTIAACEFLGNGNDGFRAASPMFYVTVDFDDCVFADNAGWGLQTQGSEDFVLAVTGCEFRLNGSGGLRLEGNETSFVSGCLVEDNLGVGILIPESLGDGNVVTNCTVQNNVGHGIAFDNTAKATGGRFTEKAGSTLISGCDILGNGGRGIHLDTTIPFAYEISDCVIYGSSDEGIGLDLSCAYVDCDLDILNTTIVGNGYAGVTYCADVATVLENCIVAYNDGPAVICCASGLPVFDCSNVYGNAGGDWTGCISGQNNVYGNFSVPPLFCDWTSGNLTLLANSPCLPGNHPYNEECGPIGALGQGCAFDGIIYVAETGSDVTGNGTLAKPFATVRTAISVAVDGNEIHLLPGTFAGDGNRDIDPLGKAIMIRSSNDNPATCIIDCGGSVFAAHRGFVVRNDETATTVLRGMTIRNGYATNGGAIHMGDPAVWNDGSSPTIENCVFEDNQATGEGGAVFGGMGSSSLITDCEFVNNSAHTGGGLSFYWMSEAAVTDCLFDGNTASYAGGGVGLSWEQFVQLNNCRFIGNSATRGGGFANYDGTSKTSTAGKKSAKIGDSLSYCEFSGNTADEGGACYTEGFTSINYSNCLFEGNTATVAGGAAYDDVTTNRYTGCTFVSNSAPVGGAYVFEGDGIPFSTIGARFRTSTFSGNDAPVGSAISFSEQGEWELEIENTIIAFGTGGTAIDNSATSPVNLTCTDIYGNAGGDWVGAITPQYGINGNISVDPEFCGPGNPSDPYTLSPSSPCAAANNPGCGQIGAHGIGCSLQLKTCAELQDYDPITGAITSPLINDVVSVEGVVYLQPGNFSPSSGGYLQDETGGINFWSSPAVLELTEGTRVRLTGPLWPEMGELYIGNYTYEILDTGQTLNLNYHTITELLSDYDHVGDFVHVPGTITSIGPSSFWLTDGVNDVEVLLSSYAGMSVAGLAVGTSGWVRGPCTILGGTMNVKPRRPTDLSLGFGGVVDVPNPGVTQFGLHAAVPNPFNPMTVIRYDLPEPGLVVLRIYDVAGRLVKALVPGVATDTGRHEAVWYGRDEAGDSVAAGVYIFSLEVGNYRDSKSMVLVK